VSARRTGRRLAVAAAVATAALLIVLLLAGDRPARFLVVEDPPLATDAVVVMAGDPAYERTTAAVAFLKATGRGTLILTGGDAGPGDSADSLREKAIALGVAPDRIRVETTSHSTREAMVATAPLLRSIGARTVTLVTSPYHARRASAAARRAWPGVTVRSLPASPSTWTAERWWSRPSGRRVVVSEYVKLAYYLCRGWI
jgi:uncharacterized SAM-binding protein YcdF (DUF218 family)